MLPAFFFATTDNTAAAMAAEMYSAAAAVASLAFSGGRGHMAKPKKVQIKV